MKVLPKISCLTVTLDRLIQLKTAIKCFCDQTYPNKELVIVTEGEARFKRAIRDYLMELNRHDIRLIALENPELNLGQLRNISIENAHGDIICQWDDDDLCHPERLRVQFEKMNEDGAAASYFTDQLHYFWEDRALAWTDWTKGSEEGPWQLIPGTIMMYKDGNFKYPESGPFAKAGEDSVFLEKLYPKLKVSRLSNFGFLYVYTYHGRNTFSKDHHDRISHMYNRDYSFFQAYDRELTKSLEYYPLAKPIQFIY